MNEQTMWLMLGYIDYKHRLSGSIRLVKEIRGSFRGNIDRIQCIPCPVNVAFNETISVQNN
jgi:hypothetical protein